ncbi:hypothetical protein [Stenotrophomonas sp. 24(2023)]|uniref:hypothetical protein n=1 Tax=Stenotrophomonas sp. 24(2023) TaxID=3068324 RepID=UPI0027E0B7D7|nr:hypothetical protein [Stenotrophomonas sp. 24(2023)]WMJ70116.1 hypothetical protein Q9R17_03135 [Stenotrophomonas sp. 24(2023)]
MDNRDTEGQGEIHGDVPAVPALEEGARVAVAHDAPTDWSMLPLVADDRDSAVMRLWRLLRHEPALMVSAGYILLSLLGLWSSYFFYLRFKLSILDYLQVSDFLVAGLRDPAYALILACGVLIAVLVGWPDTVRRRNPAKVEALRARHWGWRVLFTHSRWTSWELAGMRPLTGLTIAVCAFMALGAASYAMTKAERIRDAGAGLPVRVHLAGDAAPLAGEARLLGSSSAFVFLWWPQQRRAEAVPISAVRRLQSVGVPVRAAPAKADTPAAAP